MCSVARNDKQEEKCIAAKTIAYSAGDDTDLIYTYSDFSLELVPAHLSALLEETSELRTIEEHIRHLVDRGWSETDTDTLKKELQQLKARGYLVTAADLIKGLRKDGNTPEERPQIDRIAWYTCDRTDALLSSIESASEMANQFGHSIPFTVFDDSSSKEMRGKTIERLTRFAREKDLPVLYAGEEEKRGFAHEVVQSTEMHGLTEEILDFALFDSEGLRYSSGANRNAFLLATAGEVVINTDDDTLFQFAGQTDNQRELELSSPYDPTDVSFFKDRERLLREINFKTVDIVSWHECILGKRLQDCLPESNEDLHLEGISSNFADILRSGKGRVRATVAGNCGDSGIGRPGLPLYLEGEARNRIMNSEQIYSEALATREVFRAVNRLTISEGHLLMASHIGLDNRDQLPPFFPLLRSQDVLFGATLRKCVNEGLIGFLPSAAHHNPLPRPHFRKEELVRIPHLFSDYLILLTLSFKHTQSNNNTEKRLKALGEFFIQTGSFSNKVFSETNREAWLTQISRHIQTLEELLDTYDGSPTYWCEDILNRIEALRDLATSDDLDIPSDIGPSRDPKEARALTRRLVRRYGELLYWWPVITDAAKDLRDSGKGMLRDL